MICKCHIISDPYSNIIYLVQKSSFLIIFFLLGTIIYRYSIDAYKFKNHQDLYMTFDWMGPLGISEIDY